MRIVEKKCPNCHANLEFDVGEQNVKCPSCRRNYAIEYEKDFVDPEVQMKAKDIQLKMLNDFDKVRSFNKVIFVFIFIFAIAIIGLSIFMGVNGYKEYQQTKDSHQEFLDNMKKEEEENKARQQEVEDAIMDQIKRQTEEN
ncbi:hypothetical protein J6X15_00840 [Candidatus Saccharibacteria bacterium]|nr:hypothetical protein [Candidatus Saccharibacteria bacterium]MBP5656116.1 hypothetical protein [Candidatus Saccharibacteria bacterium]